MILKCKTFSKKEEVLLKLLKEVKEVFAKYNIKFWLDAGALLGYIREGKIIEWDKDIDIGVMGEDLTKNNLIFHEFYKKGIFLKEPIIREGKFFTFWCWKYGHWIEICPYYPLNKNLLICYFPYVNTKNRIALFFWHLLFLAEIKKKIKVNKTISQIMGRVRFFIASLFFYFFGLLPEKLKSQIIKMIRKILLKNKWVLSVEQVVPSFYFRKFKSAKFYDIDIMIPANPEGYLEYRYGHDWKIPKKEWNWIKNDKTVQSFPKSIL